MKSVIVIIIAVGVVYPDLSYAYIDPGTGSILIQGIIGAIAAIGVTLKLYWHRIIGVFKRNSAKDSVSGDAAGTGSTGDADDSRNP